MICWEYISIIASNIPQTKIIAVRELLDSTHGESPKNAGVYLEISFLDCLTTKKFQDFSRTFPKFQQNSRTFQDFPGLVGTMNWVISKLTWRIWRILTRALESFKNVPFNGLLLSKVYIVWAKKVQRSYFSWNWRGIQNLERDWLVVSRLI